MKLKERGQVFLIESGFLSGFLTCAFLAQVTGLECFGCAAGVFFALGITARVVSQGRAVAGK